MFAASLFMPSKKRSQSQVKSDRRALRILREKGLLSKSTNLSKKPTRYQRAQIRKFADVVAGKAKVVRPKAPSTYKNLFRVKGDKVVVPRRKGEKIDVDRRGEIVGKRKVGTRVVRSRFRRVRRGEDVGALPPRGGGPKQYALPFNRGGGEIEWKRFPDMAALRDFMQGYDYKNWTDYVVEEDIDEELDDDELQERLDRRLGYRKRSRERTSRRGAQRSRVGKTRRAGKRGR
jgi:hypothetical protein